MSNVYQFFRKNDKSTNNTDSDKFMKIIDEMLQAKEKILKSRKNTTRYGKMISRLYWFGLIGCASLSTISGLISFLFEPLQWVSFVFLLLLQICYLFYQFFSSINLYSSNLKEISDLFFTKLIKLSEQSIEIGLISLNDSYLNLKGRISLNFGAFKFLGVLPSIVVISVIIFKMKINPWALVIAYVNIGMLFLANIAYDRLMYFDNMILLTKLALKEKSGK